MAPGLIPIREAKLRPIRVLRRSGSRCCDDEHPGQGAGDADGLRGVGAGLVADLVTVVVEDFRLERIRGSALGDLVVGDVRDAPARGVAGGVGGFGPIDFGRGFGVGRRVGEGESEDFVHLAAVFHGFEFDRVEDAVAGGLLVVVYHQVGRAGRFFRVHFRKVFLELAFLLVGPGVPAEVGEAHGVYLAHVGQAVFLGVSFGGVDVLSGSETGEIHGCVFGGSGDRFPAIFNAR